MTQLANVDQAKGGVRRQAEQLLGLLRHFCLQGNMRQNFNQCLNWLAHELPCQRLSVILFDQNVQKALLLAQLDQEQNSSYQGQAASSLAYPVSGLELLENSLNLGGQSPERLGLARLEGKTNSQQTAVLRKLLQTAPLPVVMLAWVDLDATRSCLLVAEKAHQPPFRARHEEPLRLCAHLARDIFAQTNLTDGTRFLPPLPEIEDWSNWDMLQHCPALVDLTARLEALARTDSTVLVLGESGVGKELVATSLHQLSSRGREPFVTVNCGALPENLADSLLFGHEKGSFTGALQTHSGYFEQANKGTLFLDEVAELSLEIQAKLLRVIETHSFQRVGGTKTLSSDLRLVAATNRDLKDLVRKGQFRADLFYRLYVYPLTIPPLRLRREDIVPLTQLIYSQLLSMPGLQLAPPLSADQAGQLCLHAWPGNVRQLRNAVERAMLEAVTMRSPSLDFAAALADDDYAPLADQVSTQGGSLKELNDKAIAAALQQSKGRIQGPHGAATLLGLSPNTLRARMRQMGLPLPRDSKRGSTTGQENPA